MKLIALCALVLGYEKKAKPRKTPETRQGLSTSTFSQSNSCRNKEVTLAVEGQV